MDVTAFLNSVYLGDRGCTFITIDGERDQLAVGVNLISRIRGERWNYYTDEDVANGKLVFAGVHQLSLNAPLASLDFVNSVKAVLAAPGVYAVFISISTINAEGVSGEATIQLNCTDAWIVDPAHPAVPIR